MRRPDERRILSIDIGGTGVKAALLDPAGRMLTERIRVPTPRPCPPKTLITTIARLVRPLGNYSFVSIGFPGVVREGKIVTAPNLGTPAWKGFDLARALSGRLGRPVRILNDADVQGLGAIHGKGVEMVITLGTGFGTAIFADGALAPHLEIAHHPFRKGDTYDEHLGNRALEKVGKKKWNRRVRLAIETLRTVVNFDRLYIGGGNARKINGHLGPHVRVISNEVGIRGGAWLWRDKLQAGLRPKT